MITETIVMYVMLAIGGVYFCEPPGIHSLR